MSVIGFDDIQLSHFTQPPLTTVRLSRDELGRKAFEALYLTLQGTETEGQQIRVSTSLVLRESTAKASLHKTAASSRGR
jgi:DNA-binding LacI/PurR family transcriptional regulator